MSERDITIIDLVLVRGRERDREREKERERDRERERQRKGLSCSLINMDQEYCHNCQFGALKLESWGSSPLGALLL